MVHPLAGQQAPAELLIDSDKLQRDYFELRPDPSDPRQAVSFGTSGHRGTASQTTFNEGHILAITQALCDWRRQQGIRGPLFLGKDTHALSRAAEQTALEVLVANGVDVVLPVVKRDPRAEFTATPIISHAILRHNRLLGQNNGAQADGIVITPSHNPPADGGFKYNATHGGPAEESITAVVQRRANELLAAGLQEVKRTAADDALRTARRVDMAGDYIADLAAVIDMEAIARRGVRIGVDPLGGASVGLWAAIAETYGLKIEVVNPEVDPRFAFMCVDHDGKIRMDCSSPYAMRGLVDLKDRFDVAVGADPDSDRHGIVTPSGGLMNPNHYLAVAIDYLFRHRPQWGEQCAVGKTAVSSSLIDRVAAGLNRRLVETPVGFKWFVDGLYSGELGFGGEESAGASFLRRDGGVWTTDKDGILLCLLAAEILAVSGRDPSQCYEALASKYGRPCYTRVDAPATPAQKNALKKLDPSAVKAATLAGDPITSAWTKAPGNDAALGGLKIASNRGWFAARPSGTEDIYKIYAESFVDEQHLRQIVAEAQQIVDAALADAR